MTPPTEPPPGERVPRIVTAVAGLVAAVTVGVGLTIHHRTGELGTASPPFVLGWAPAADLAWLLLAAVASAAAALLLPRLLEVALPAPAVAAGLFAVALGLGLAINAARTGMHAWSEPFDLQGGLARGNAINEYLPGLGTLDDGVPNYLDRFAEVVPSQSVNVAGHRRGRSSWPTGSARRPPRASPRS
ncbi:MAG: hypothetical protein PGN13_00765 [Patulibacter minatonensis]